MDLILWRHAEAADGWLRARLTGSVSVISSPAERALQTASAFTHGFVVDGSIAPGASAHAVLNAVGWPDATDPVVLVGHQPTLGEAAALLLTGKSLPWGIKKGAVWWLRHRVRDGHAQVVLRAVMSPDLLR